MRSFFKIFFASCLSLIVFALISVVVVFIVIGAAMAPGKPEIGKKAVLIVDLAQGFHEQSSKNAMAELTGDIDSEIPGIYETVRLIENAKKDDNIQGIYIKCNDNVNGFATSEEFRNALIDFKKSKKFVIAYGEVISQSAYYVASAADRVYCNPKGGLDWRGFASTLFFLKGTLEKLDIQPQIFYAGKFKSATEPLREYKMSEANRIQTSEYLNDLYGNLLTAAALHSKLDTASLHALANNGTIQTAADAVRHRLLDGIRYDDQVKAEMINSLKIGATDKINFVSVGRYAKAVDFTSGKGRIAIINAEGEIVDGKGDETSIGSDEFRNLIRKVRLDKNVKAIVLRVNSPGGSALASEVILRELNLAKKDKPLVVSFGDVAASGGYYISTNADSIFAQPNTITGSIGVFGIIPNMQSFFKNKLGITFDGVKTGPFADMASLSRPLNETEKRFIQNTIDTIYMNFKSHVAQGRKKSLEYVDSIAQGRVWTGQRAIQIGLVDKLGNIQDAVNCAARMAKLSDYSIKDYPEKKSFFETFFSEKKSEVKVAAIKEEIGSEQYDILMQLKSVRKMIAIPQTRMPYNIKVQ